MTFNKNILFSSFFIACILFLLGLTVHRYWLQAGLTTDSVIAEHIEQLSGIFKKIDTDCGIIDFEHSRNYIDFLTVIAFVGSEIGAMNLKYPNNWQGPYIQDNPTVQTKYYEIVKTKHGYWIVPGQGVRLSNGNVIGKDIIFDENTDMPKLLETKTILINNNRALVAPLKSPFNEHV